MYYKKDLGGKADGSKTLLQKPDFLGEFGGCPCGQIVGERARIELYLHLKCLLSFLLTPDLHTHTHTLTF